MRLTRCIPVLALLVFLPARADEGGVKTPPQGGVKSAETKAEKMSCCARENEKALCPKAKDQTTPESKKQAARKTPAPAAAQAAPAGAANMVVTRDPETGEIRSATAAEREKLFAGRTPQAAPAAPRVVTLPDGTRMVQLDEESMSYAVATKAPDGAIRHNCVHGAEAATEARTAPKPAPAPRTEER